MLNNLHLAVMQGSVKCFIFLVANRFSDVHDSTADGETILSLVQGDQAMSKLYYCAEKQEFKKTFS